MRTDLEEVMDLESFMICEWAYQDAKVLHGREPTDDEIQEIRENLSDRFFS